MKGLKAYLQSQELRKRLYAQNSSLNEKEKKELYQLYFDKLKKSAYLGHFDGLYDFAQQYENMNFLGIKNPLYNPKKCIFWYSKACSKGHAEACNNLATFHETGNGCKRNLNSALELYQRSAALGSPNGKKNHRTMIKDLVKGGKYNK